MAQCNAAHAPFQRPGSHTRISCIACLRLQITFAVPVVPQQNVMADPKCGAVFAHGCGLIARFGPEAMIDRNGMQPRAVQRTKTVHQMQQRHGIAAT